MIDLNRIYKFTDDGLNYYYYVEKEDDRYRAVWVVADDGKDYKSSDWRDYDSFKVWMTGDEPTEWTKDEAEICKLVVKL